MQIEILPASLGQETKHLNGVTDLQNLEISFLTVFSIHGYKRNLKKTFDIL